MAGTILAGPHYVKSSRRFGGNEKLLRPNRHYSSGSFEKIAASHGASLHGSSNNWKRAILTVVILTGSLLLRPGVRELGVVQEMLVRKRGEKCFQIRALLSREREARYER